MTHQLYFCQTFVSKYPQTTVNSRLAAVVTQKPKSKQITENGLCQADESLTRIMASRHVERVNDRDDTAWSRERTGQD